VCARRGGGGQSAWSRSRRLLRDSLPAYTDRGNDYESQMISRVFFDPEPEANKRKRPGELFYHSADGPPVAPLQKVQVTCKRYAPSMGSVSPDGYWYRLASPPYNNQYYAVANTFLNGNPVEGTSKVKQNNTDWKGPDCPN
jgi:hypothetical protein